MRGAEGAGAIESGRNEFLAAQSKLIDQRRQYQTALGNVWGGWWMRLAGYPHIDLTTEYLPISTDRTIEAATDQWIPTPLATGRFCKTPGARSFHSWLQSLHLNFVSSCAGDSGVASICFR